MLFLLCCFQSCSAVRGALQCSGCTAKGGGVWCTREHVWMFPLSHAACQKTVKANPEGGKWRWKWMEKTSFLGGFIFPVIWMIKVLIYVSFRTCVHNIIGVIFRTHPTTCGPTGFTLFSFSSQHSRDIYAITVLFISPSKYEAVCCQFKVDGFKCVFMSAHVNFSEMEGFPFILAVHNAPRLPNGVLNVPIILN